MVGLKGRCWTLNLRSALISKPSFYQLGWWLTFSPSGRSELGARKSILGVGMACAAAWVLPRCAFAPKFLLSLVPGWGRTDGWALGVSGTGQRGRFWDRVSGRRAIRVGSERAKARRGSCCSGLPWYGVIPAAGFSARICKHVLRCFGVSGVVFSGFVGCFFFFSCFIFLFFSLVIASHHLINVD